MNVLLDTHVLLWFVAGDARLSSIARQTIEADDTINYVSMASWWEIAVKCSLGKLTLDDPLDLFMKQRTAEGFKTLSLEPQHLQPLITLPFHHRDPFDRLIICQSMVENMAICTCDENIKRYPISLIW
ncbi:MAG: type II toxin-antitoxin system VapC family toxin [Kiritimatiellia bacterium]